MTVKESVKGGLIAGATTAIGGLILGPPGLAIGGAVGGCAAYVLAGNKFRPLSAVILYDMGRDDQQRLVEAVRNLVSHLDAGDALELMAIVNGNAVLKARIVSEMTSFFQQQLSMTVGAR